MPIQRWQERFGEFVARKQQEAARAVLPPYVTEEERPGPGMLAENLPSAFERLRALGVTQVSAIGGRRIATQLIEAGLVRDVYLTTSPRPGGEPNTPMYPKPLKGAVVVRKRGTGSESGVIFEHVRLTAT